MNAFGHIVGQDDATMRLADSLERDRVPHGLLFAGPDGVGKRTTAEALAAALLGDDRGRVASGSHPDYHPVSRTLARFHDATGKSKATTINVEVVREEVNAPANRMSTEGGGKAFVIEDAHLMNAAAQNALLKTLEEPAGRTVIVLLTDRPESLLPTVRSRCQTLRFRELSDDEAVGVMTAQGIDEADARRAVAVAGGSPGRATRFLEDGVIGRAAALFDALDRGGEGVADLLQQAAEAHAAAALERDPLDSKDALTRQGHALYLDLAADHFRRRLRADEGDLEAVCRRIDAAALAHKYLAANVSVPLALRQFELSVRS